MPRGVNTVLACTHNASTPMGVYRMPVCTHTSASAQFDYNRETCPPKATTRRTIPGTVSPQHTDRLFSVPVHPCFEFSNNGSAVSLPSVARATKHRAEAVILKSRAAFCTELAPWRVLHHAAWREHCSLPVLTMRPSRPVCTQCLSANTVQHKHDFD